MVRYVLLLLFLLFLLVSLVSFAGPALVSFSGDPVVSTTSTPPLVDGNSLDECWKKIQPVKVAYSKIPGETASVWLCRDAENIYILVKFPARKEYRKHRYWHWDPVYQFYISGPEQEQLLCLLFTPLISNPARGDVWLWRSGRTDPAGFADDGFYHRDTASRVSPPNHPDSAFHPDSGSSCWYSKYFSKFAGAKLPRFYSRPPAGSMADVRAKGKWDGGLWIVEFQRRLQTKQADDLPFKEGGEYQLQLQLSCPQNIPAGPARALRFKIGK